MIMILSVELSWFKEHFILISLKLKVNFFK